MRAERERVKEAGTRERKRVKGKRGGEKKRERGRRERQRKQASKASRRLGQDLRVFSLLFLLFDKSLWWPVTVVPICSGEQLFLETVQWLPGRLELGKQRGSHTAPRNSAREESLKSVFRAQSGHCPNTMKW